MPLKISVRSVLPAKEIGDLMVVGVPTLGGGTSKKNKNSGRLPRIALGGPLHFVLFRQSHGRRRRIGFR